MKRGEYDRRVRIERFTLVDDGYNEVEQFAELATVWAKYMPIKGTERFELQGREEQRPASFQIRWQPLLADLSAKDRLYEVVNGERVGPIYNITSAFEVERREDIRIDATAGD